MKIVRYLTASIAALVIVVSLAAFGNRQLSQSQSSAPNFSAYPLPGTPTPKAPVGAPTRAAYPLPGSPTAKPSPTTAGRQLPPPASPQLTYSVYPPLVLMPCISAKGTAGIVFANTDPGFTGTLGMQACWGYNWNLVYTSTSSAYSMPWVVVNDVRSKITGTWDISIDSGCLLPSGDHFSAAVQSALQTCVGNIAASRPGMNWMLWNEPDGGGGDQDNISPSLAISYFVVISNTILKNDPTARLIVGNIAGYYPPQPATDCCGVYWLSHFITEGHNIGITVTGFIAGYGFHAYPNLDERGIGGANGCGVIPALYYTTTDPCLLNNFSLTVKTASDWLAVNDPGKELWLTEFNWWPVSDGSETYDTQKRRMGLMCVELKKWPVTRFGWYVAENYSVGVLNLFLYPYTGALSPSGVSYTSC